MFSLILKVKLEKKKENKIYSTHNAHKTATEWTFCTERTF